MGPNRREFLWTLGTAAGALVLLRLDDVLWSPQLETGPGWAPGLEQHVASACLACPAHCGIAGRVVDGSLVRIVGNPLHPMSRGGVCPRAVAGPQLLYHPDRIASPLVRAGEQWRSATHDEVVAEVTERLTAMRDEGRPEGLAVVTGHARGTMHDVWRQFLEAFGSPNLVVDGYNDGTDAVAEAMHGIPRRPSYDLENADMVISFGAQLFESWWSPVQAYAAFARLGIEGSRPRRFVQVDQRLSRTAAYADAWVGVAPGTHAVLALGLAYVILRDRLFDEAFLAEHVTGFEDFTDGNGRRRSGFRSVVLQRYRTEEVSAITGVSVERITDLARSFAASSSPLAVCGRDVTLAPDGLLAGMAVHSLNVLVGNINRPGGVMFGSDPPLAPLATVARDDTGRTGVARAAIAGTPPRFGGGDPATSFARAIAEGSADPPQVLLIHGCNPVASSARADLWKQALEMVPFLVSFSPFLDETTQYADLILPDLLPFERWQDAPTPESYPYACWGVARPMVEPPPNGPHAGEVVFGLAAGVGGAVAESLPYRSVEALLKSRARGLLDAHRGGVFGNAFELETQRQRGERGWWLAPTGDFDGFWSDLVDRGGWVDMFYDRTDPDRLARTPTGRIELMPAALLEALEEEGSVRAPYTFGSRQADGGDDSFPLRLLPYRISTLTSETTRLERWLREQPSVLSDVQWVPWVGVAPATAEALGLSQETMVWVVSRRDRYRARLQVSVGIAPHTVAAPLGLTHPDGEPANPLRLLDGSSDPLTGLPSWITTFVRLERA